MDYSNQSMLICDSATAQAVLAADSRLAKDYGLVSLLAKSRLNTDGHSWNVRRQLSQRQLMDGGKPSAEPFVDWIFADAFQSAPASGASLRDEILKASLRIFLGTMGISPPVDLLFQWMKDSRELLTRLQYRSWVAPGAVELQELQDQCVDARRQLRTILEQDEASCELMRRFDEAGKGVDGFDAVEELAMITFGGSETTTASILWCLDVAGRSTDVQNRMRDEVLTNSPDAKYLRTFIHEVLRRFPAVPMVTRKCLEDVELNGRMFHKGQTILISIVGLHHQADKWHDPDVFDASRAEFMQRSYDRQSFMPFSAGARTCGGTRLAMLEIEQALRHFLRNFNLRQSADHVGFDYSLAMAPSTSGTIELTPR